MARHRIARWLSTGWRVPVAFAGWGLSAPTLSGHLKESSRDPVAVTDMRSSGPKAMSPADGRVRVMLAHIRSLLRVTTRSSPGA